MSSESVPGPDSRVRLVLWRHGQTPWNVQGRFQGQTDIQLDEVGVEQAERAARLLAALRPDVIISSDLSRAMATAAPLSRLTGLTVTTDKDLRERHGGAWEGLTDVEIRTRYPVEHAQWFPPEGETLVDRRGPRGLGHGADRRQPPAGFSGRRGEPRRGDQAGRRPAARPARGPLGRRSGRWPTAPGRSCPAGTGTGGWSSTTRERCRSRCSATTAEVPGRCGLAGLACCGVGVLRGGVQVVRGRPGNRYANSGPRASHAGDAGAIAQLVERLHGMQEVSGSSPLSSTRSCSSGHDLRAVRVPSKIV